MKQKTTTTTTTTATACEERKKQDSAPKAIMEKKQEAEISAAAEEEVAEEENESQSRVKFIKIKTKVFDFAVFPIPFFPLAPFFRLFAGSKGTTCDGDKTTDIYIYICYNRREKRNE